MVLPLGSLVPSSEFYPWVLLPSWPLKTFLSTLSSAHLEYLHLVSTLLTWCNSLVRSSGPVQTTLALWVSVLTILYLAVRLWWLSHCKYSSVGMDFLYTVMDKELSASGLTKVSRKGIVPFPWLPSAVNLIAGSILLIWFRSFAFAPFFEWQIYHLHTSSKV